MCSAFYVVQYFCITQTFRDIELYKRLDFVFTLLRAIDVLQSRLIHTSIISVTTVVVFSQTKTRHNKVLFCELSNAAHLSNCVFSRLSIYVRALPKMK